jgi:hypothetical protein
MSVRLAEIWTASYADLSRVFRAALIEPVEDIRELVSRFYLRQGMLEQYDAGLMDDDDFSRFLKAALMEPIEDIRELVARFYLSQGMLEQYDAELMAYDDFSLLMASDKTFESKYYTLEVNNLSRQMSLRTIKFEKEVVKMLDHKKHTTLYYCTTNTIECRDPETLELKDEYSFAPSLLRHFHGSILYHDNKIFVLIRSTRFFYIDLTTRETTVLLNAIGMISNGPFLWKDEVVVTSMEDIFIYTKGNLMKFKRNRPLTNVAMDPVLKTLVIGNQVSRGIVTIPIGQDMRKIEVLDFHISAVYNGLCYEPSGHIINTVNITGFSGEICGIVKSVGSQVRSITVSDNRLYVSYHKGFINEYTLDGNFIREIAPIKLKWGGYPHYDNMIVYGNNLIAFRGDIVSINLITLQETTANPSHIDGESILAVSPFAYSE